MSKTEQIKLEGSEGVFPRPEVESFDLEKVKDAVRRVSALLDSKGEERIRVNREEGALYMIEREDGGVRFEKSYMSRVGQADIGKPFVYSATLYPDGSVKDHFGEMREAALGGTYGLKDRVSSRQMSQHDLSGHMEAVESVG